MTVQKVNAPAKAKGPVCVDCITEGVTTFRPIVTEGKLAKFSGPRKPRCVTHARAVRAARRLATHARVVEKTYGISGEQYWTLYEAQGGKCAICRWASGKAKRLAVDHDHKSGRVLGLLCGRCNVNRGFYGNESLVRWLEYNLDPPAPGIIGEVTVPVYFPECSCGHALTQHEGESPTGRCFTCNTICQQEDSSE